MARYILEDGTETTTDDPRRLVWFSAGCGYWTDDWASLSKSFEIPICPSCNSPGFMAVAEKWLQNAADFETIGHPGYVEWLKSAVGRCLKGRGNLEHYHEWIKQRAAKN
jgi:hypothetical protein